jgi:hypothetical protein
MDNLAKANHCEEGANLAGGPAGLPLCRWYWLAGNQLSHFSSVPFAVSPQWAALTQTIIEIRS